MEFTPIQNEEISSEKNLICPITHKIFQDPVLAGDGHVYERAAIVEWIQANGTSPITLEPLHIDDLVPEENIKRLCHRHRQQIPVAYTPRNEEVTLSPLQVSQILPVTQQPPIMAIPPRSIQDNNRMKYIGGICFFIILLILVVIISIVLIVGSRSSDSSTHTVATFSSPNTGTPASYSTTYILPNNCTLKNITTLLSLNNTAAFDYTFYSVLYTAVDNETMITFAFRQDPAYWVIDDISVQDETSGIEVLQNGDFEDETFAPFSYCNQQGVNVAIPPPGNQSHAGSYAFVDFTPYTPDYISQMLILTIGRVYNVTFWLLNADGPPNSFMVMMSV